MITQGSDTLYSLEELIELLKNNNKTVLGIDEWYLDKTLNQYYEVPTYDFSEWCYTNEQITQLIINKQSYADMYSVVLDD